MSFDVSLIGEGDWDHCSVRVECGNGCVWVCIETDPYEGSSMLTPALARKVHEELGRALREIDEIKRLREELGE